MGLEAAELARWTMIAANGGIGKCTATCHCITERPNELIFLKDDEITVLYQLPDQEHFYLGYCGGIVGWFNGADVHFHSKLMESATTKRVTAESGNLPTLFSDVIMSAPFAQPPTHHWKESDTQSDSLERQPSTGHTAHVTSPTSFFLPLSIRVDKNVIDGLGYARSEEDHGPPEAASLVPSPTTPSPAAVPAPFSPSSTSTTTRQPNPQSPFPIPDLGDFLNSPTPPFICRPLKYTWLSPGSLPTIEEHGRRSSLTLSTTSAASTASCDGASDISDDDFFSCSSQGSDVQEPSSQLDVGQDTDVFLRAESPATSISSGGGLLGQPSPTIDSGIRIPQMFASPTFSTSPTPSRSTTDAESSMDAYRQCEQKWMSVMASIPASQARTNKKVRELVSKGVPPSVRYLVWSYLTNSKARCVPGVYLQLCGRGRVSISAEMERDIRGCFQDLPYLHGPALSLLQAYMRMVPDVQYAMGLTLIVGRLLLLAPEEDAFWIFVSIMDTHIRPYFSPRTTQMEVDSALFSCALESNDAMVAKLLVDKSIPPASICQPWFSSLFIRPLPPEYLSRVWDVFFFEGVPFLLRVALAVITCCRWSLLDSRNKQSVLQTLERLPRASLPPTPDAFLSLAFSFKLKDDHVRKQRTKMEAQVKHQSQVQRTASAGRNALLASLDRETTTDCSLASSRTISTDYGVYYTRRAISQESMTSSTLF